MIWVSLRTNKAAERSVTVCAFQVFFLAFCAAANAARLDNAYLPPPNAKDAGGRDEDLQVPLEPPYIDPYSDNRHLVPADHGRNEFGRRIGSRRNQPRGDQDEDFVRGFAPGMSRFLYGSYSYTGPDNVLVTVTYTADRKRPKNRRRYDDDEYDDYDYGRRAFGYDADDDDYSYAGPLEGGVIPTPPSLPKELQKAFAFHRKKYQSEGKKDSRKVGARTEEPPRRPVIHQGYSYPKAVTN
ncbi:UNVERIFIED_CONTAM: hypothetical protein PYX00_009281 [Menopon gallinae]|uniref:Secreted protein n=1 Tax=Menopon gallinae TaxID=328185 RepID=A0AAW2HAJ0_9NEOP